MYSKANYIKPTHLNRGRNLLFTDLLVLFSLGSCLKPLPRKTAYKMRIKPMGFNKALAENKAR